jgi:hypothetical protein
MHLVKQRIDPLALFCNQIGHIAAPILAFLRKQLLKLVLNLLRDPRVEPRDQVHSSIFSISFIARPRYIATRAILELLEPSAQFQRQPHVPSLISGLTR